MRPFMTYEARRINISLTPLIDIVFILLVFFMLTSSFSKDYILPFKMPELTLMDQDSSPEGGENLQNTLIILPQEVKWNDVITPLDQVISQIKNTEDPKMILRATEETDLARLVNIIDALRAIPALKVQMTVPPKKAEDVAQ